MIIPMYDGSYLLIGHQPKMTNDVEGRRYNKIINSVGAYHFIYDVEQPMRRGIVLNYDKIEEHCEHHFTTIFEQIVVSLVHETLHNYLTVEFGADTSEKYDKLVIAFGGVDNSIPYVGRTNLDSIYLDAYHDNISYDLGFAYKNKRIQDIFKGMGNYGVKDI